MSSLFSRLRGVGQFFQLGGPTGPQWKSNAGGLEARNAADAAFVPVRVASPATASDAVPFASLGANAAAASTGPGNLTATPTYAPIAKVTNFIPTATGKVDVACSAVCTNTDVAIRLAALGVIAVPTGGPAPTTADYPPLNANNNSIGPGGASVTTSLLCRYGGGGSFPAALAVGTGYDVYLMGVSDAGAVVAWGADGCQITLQEVTS